MIRAIKSMLQDIHICSSLSHSNIIPYLEVITIPDEQTHFPFSTTLIFMPLCHGDMTDMLTHIGTFTTRMCQHWMRQITPAVRYLHERDIVHLDIKPENILVQFGNMNMPINATNIANLWPTITYLLSDFGLAKKYLEVEAQVRTGPIGTDRYMAKELFERDIYQQYNKVQTKPCDVYSLGATLVRCFTESNLFRGFQRNLFQFIQFVSANPHFRSMNAPHITSEWAQFIQGLVNDDPKQRYTIQQVVDHPILTAIRRERLCTIL